MASSNSSDENACPNPYPVGLLPVLIIPGFMSSGLEVQESKVRPDWNGKRLWINLTSLGIESMHSGDTCTKSAPPPQEQPDDNGEKKQIEYKSDWLNHISLKLDMKTERDGVTVRPVPGLAGVDYLTPGALTNHVSYVFGPVIHALVEEGGYKAGVNLDAASYDWRIPPTEMERRDGYFSKTASKVEDLYEKNQQTPVVLLCHSLGCKMGHYFLNFCLKAKGQDWIHKYIHTYMPVGGPHLGAPKAVRSVISGDQMGLETFLSKEESVAFGRTLGSGPWLFPEDLPLQAPACSFYYHQGSLKLTAKNSAIDVGAWLKQRRAIAHSCYFKLAFVFGGKTVMTDYHTVSSGAGGGKKKQEMVKFPETFLFATEAKRVTNDDGKDDFQVLLLEPGSSVSKRDKRKKDSCLCWCCCCPCMLLMLPFRMLGCLLREVTILSAEAVSRAIGGSTILAASAPMKMSDILSQARPTSSVSITLHERDEKKHSSSGFCCAKPPMTEALTVEFEWTPHQESMHEIMQLTDKPRIAVPHKESTVDKDLIANEKNKKYSGCRDMLAREGLTNILDVMKAEYETDPLDARGMSSRIAPPVRQIKAIYGVNLPTEVGTVYRRRPGSIQRHARSVYKLDKTAKLSAQGKKLGYTINRGIIMETNKTKQLDDKHTSGDGTVPYYSLSHVTTWQSPACKVDVTEIDKADHREILADKRFHEAVMDYVCVGGREGKAVSSTGHSATLY